MTSASSSDDRPPQLLRPNENGELSFSAAEEERRGEGQPEKWEEVVTLLRKMEDQITAKRAAGASR